MLSIDIVARRKSLIYSSLSCSIGQNLKRKYGMYASARYLRNLGLSLEYALEVLAMRVK